MKTIVIIGGGAAGLTAAIAAKRITGAKADIIIAERCERVGKKILSTGNGRCNLTNERISGASFHGGDTGKIAQILRGYGPDVVMDFFGQLGLRFVSEGGRIYPMSGQASAVSDVLRGECARLGVTVRTNFEAGSVAARAGRYIVASADGQTLAADMTLIAAGGRSSPHLGSNGSGYRLLEALGHKCTRVFPSLVQLKADIGSIKGLDGIRLDAGARVFVGDKVAGSETGEVLFTKYGLSGPAIFAVSRTASEYCDRQKVTIKLDIMPDTDENALLLLISERTKLLPYKTLEDFFTGMFHKRVGQCAFGLSGIAPLSRESGSLRPDEIRRLAHTIKNWTVPVTGTLSWQYSQVTAGGIALDAINAETMESTLARGVYAAGEVLDADGDCGGYNLHWAWATGLRAGKAMGETVTDA